jgi:hypothetical protein
MNSNSSYSNSKYYITGRREGKFRITRTMRKAKTAIIPTPEKFFCVECKTELRQHCLIPYSATVDIRKVGDDSFNGEVSFTCGVCSNDVVRSHHKRVEGKSYPLYEAMLISSVSEESLIPSNLFQ